MRLNSICYTVSSARCSPRSDLSLQQAPIVSNSTGRTSWRHPGRFWDNDQSRQQPRCAALPVTANRFRHGGAAAGKPRIAPCRQTMAARTWRIDAGVGSSQGNVERPRKQQPPARSSGRLCERTMSVRQSVDGEIHGCNWRQCPVVRPRRDACQQGECAPGRYVHIPVRVPDIRCWPSPCWICGQYASHRDALTAGSG